MVGALLGLDENEGAAEGCSLGMIDTVGDTDGLVVIVGRGLWEGFEVGTLEIDGFALIVGLVLVEGEKLGCIELVG